MATTSPARTALVRRPTPDLVDGIVTHVERRPVDPDLALEQHAGYRAALADAGWTIREVDPAPGCPDAVFVEDTVVVVGRTAILTRPGADTRRAEVAGTEKAVRDLGLDVVALEAPATLEGGDVLQVGNRVYVGRGGRTNAAGILQLRSVAEPLGCTVVPVRLDKVLHLKSAVTALPDGTFLALPDLLEQGGVPAPRPVEEEAGCHVVPLGGDDVLISSSAPRTIDRLADIGYRPRVVDIGEFEKLEGCVTCLSVLVHPQAP
jgi:dimethylargininase